MLDFVNGPTVAKISKNTHTHAYDSQIVPRRASVCDDEGGMIRVMDCREQHGQFMQSSLMSASLEYRDTG